MGRVGEGLLKERHSGGSKGLGVRYSCDWHDDGGSWFCSYGNENWEFDEHGLTKTRYDCVNDLSIKETERKFFWPQGRRFVNHPSLSPLGL